MHIFFHKPPPFREDFFDPVRLPLVTPTPKANSIFKPAPEAQWLLAPRFSAGLTQPTIYRSPGGTALIFAPFQRLSVGPHLNHPPITGCPILGTSLFLCQGWDEHITESSHSLRA